MVSGNQAAEAQWAAGALASIEGLRIQPSALLSQHTRFGLGGPCWALIDISNEGAFRQALGLIRASQAPHAIIGQGSNLIVSDQGFAGLVLRYTASNLILRDGQIEVEAGVLLQTLVDVSIQAGLEGLHTMTGIPGWVGGAIYGNAGAYGHSIHEFVRQVRFFDGEQVRVFDPSACQFAYRESIFKRRKEWTILSAILELPPGNRQALQAEAHRIRQIRDQKYPPQMKCAGSIFKNLLFSELEADVAARVPSTVIREGKVPSAWFLEQVGAKGMRRGGIQVAAYHANLIYNDGNGTAAELLTLIQELKTRVWREFGLQLEEEVQYVGFSD
ncbi:MAG: UDP-N-acetylmuramate dehydrogenase [Bryobacteraceae bacterium]|nr:UDP-N-acetylmuramate dehydrogenase [Bryobacteraceae bacterium]MDW8379335.1 UDP-N-acetylmuramate dehydrogenase [Bryobacterales bacterium]